MDALKGRNQTTKGIWFAKSTKISEPVTMVLDLEGSDGRERGEDDTSFERQSSLFALAVADILLVNMWAKDIGREAGSGKPLLKTIFQVCGLQHHQQHHVCQRINKLDLAVRLEQSGHSDVKLFGETSHITTDKAREAANFTCCAGQPQALHTSPKQAKDCAAVCLQRHDKNPSAAAEGHLGGRSPEDVGINHQTPTL